MRTLTAWALVLGLGAGLSGCQFISGVNDLEVVQSASGGSGGTGASGGSGGSGGSTATSSGGTTTSSGGSGGSSGGSGGSTSSGGSSTTGNPCTSQPGWECDVATNCGCDNGESCGYDADTNTAYCSPPGDEEPYSGCDDNLDCPLGHGCIGSVCKQYCLEASDCGWDSAECLEVYDDDEVVEGFGFCSSECNLLDPSAPDVGSVACGDDSTCFPVVDDNDALENTLCIGTESEAGQDEPCLDADGFRDFLACAPGYFCSGLSNSCQKWCEVDDADCELGAECVGFDPPFYVGDDELGSCYTCASGDSECSLYPSCGCAAGEICQVGDLDTGTTVCGAPGPAGLWEECTGLAGCAEGGCVAGICRPFCQGPDTSTCDTGECVSAYNDVGPIPGVFYCDTPCEPAPGSGDSSRLDCPGSLSCLPVSDPTDAAGAYCIESEGALVGTSCEGAGHAACADGLGCIESVCAPWCRDDSDCTASYPFCALDLTNDYFVVSGDLVGLCVAELL